MNELPNKKSRQLMLRKEIRHYYLKLKWTHIFALWPISNYKVSISAPNTISSKNSILCTKFILETARPQGEQKSKWKFASDKKSNPLHVENSSVAGNSTRHLPANKWPLFILVISHIKAVISALDDGEVQYKRYMSNFVGKKQKIQAKTH